MQSRVGNLFLYRSCEKPMHVSVILINLMTQTMPSLPELRRVSCVNYIILARQSVEE